MQNKGTSVLHKFYLYLNSSFILHFLLRPLLTKSSTAEEYKVHLYVITINKQRFCSVSSSIVIWWPVSTVLVSHSVSQVWTSFKSKRKSSENIRASTDHFRNTKQEAKVYRFKDWLSVTSETTIFHCWHRDRCYVSVSHIILQFVCSHYPRYGFHGFELSRLYLFLLPLLLVGQESLLLYALCSLTSFEQNFKYIFMVYFKSIYCSK